MKRKERKKGLKIIIIIRGDGRKETPRIRVKGRGNKKERKKYDNICIRFWREERKRSKDSKWLRRML